MTLCLGCDNPACRRGGCQGGPRLFVDPVGFTFLAWFVGPLVAWALLARPR